MIQGIEEAISKCKTCTGCKKEKFLEDYSLHKEGKFGRTAKCKSCCKEYAAKYYKINHKKIKANSVSWGKRTGYRTKYSKTVRAINPLKYTARRKIWLEIEQGRLKQQPCEICKHPKAQAHHSDYTKPLDVQWLCIPHHLAWHKLFQAITAANEFSTRTEVRSSLGESKKDSHE